MHISTAHGGALELESDTEGLLAQLAHICLLVGWVGGVPTPLLLASHPAQLTNRAQNYLQSRFVAF